MARTLTGAEAEAWIASHPNATYYDNRTGQMVNQSTPSSNQGGNFFTNLLKTASKPFRTIPALAQELALTGKDLVNTAKGDYANVRKVNGGTLGNGTDYFGLTKEESKALEEDPLQAGIKAAAGVASNAITGGQGATAGARILDAAKAGALSSALGGFSQSKSGNELEDTLKGAGLGAVLGGATQGIGEGVKKGVGAIRSKATSGKVKKVAGDLSKYADDAELTQYKKNIGSTPTKRFGKGKQVEETFNLEKSLGLNHANNGEELLSNMQSIIDEYGSHADDLASEFTKEGRKMNIKDILSKLDNKLSSTKDPSARNAISSQIDRFTEALQNAGVSANGDIDAQSLLNLKREFGDAISSAWMTNSDNVTTNTLKDIYMGIDDTLANTFEAAGSKFKDYRDVNKILNSAIDGRQWAIDSINQTTANLQGLNDPLQDAMRTGFTAKGLLGAVSGGALSKYLQDAGVGLSAKATRGTANLLNNLAETAGNTATTQAASVPGQTLNQIIPRLGSAISQGAAEKNLSPAEKEINEYLQQQGIGQETQTDSQSNNQSTTNWKNSMGLSQNDIVTWRNVLTQGVLDGSISKTDGDAIWKYLGLEEVPTETAKGNSKADAALETLEQFKAYNSNPLGSFMSTIGLNIGSNARSLEALRKDLKSTITNLMSGTTASDQERKEMLELIPNFWDTEESTRVKLESLERKIRGFSK